jgi:hypothetical protein
VYVGNSLEGGVDMDMDVQFCRFDGEKRGMELAGGEVAG